MSKPMASTVLKLRPKAELSNEMESTLKEYKSPRKQSPIF